MTAGAFPRSAINIASMPDLNDEHHQLLVLDPINDPVITQAQAKDVIRSG